MKTMELNIRNLIFQLVPFHKRLPNRLAWLNSLLAPLMKLWDDFHAWRIKTRMMVNVNSQRMVLENYLQIKYNTTSIRIENYSDEMFLFALSSESESLQPEIFSTYDPEEDRDDIPHIPIHDERLNRFEGVDFIVYIPGMENKEEEEKKREQIKADIERYRQALIKYRIQ